MTENQFDVVAFDSPFKRPVATYQCFEGMSINDIIRHAEIDPKLYLHLEVTVSIGARSSVVPMSSWALVRPRRGTHVKISPVVHGAALAPLLSTLIAAAAPTIAGALFPTLAAGSFGLALATAAVSIVGALLIRALIPPPSQSTVQNDDPVFNLTGASNDAAPYETYPSVLGRHIMFPRKTAAGYTETVEDEIYLRERMTFGYGPVSLSDIKIGTTPIHEFEGVEVEFLNVDQARTEAAIPELTSGGITVVGWRQGTEAMTLYPDDIAEDTYSVLLEADQSVVRQTRTASTSASVDIAFQGLVHITGGGTKNDRSVDVKIEYREVGDTVWTTHETKTCTENTTAYVRFTSVIDFPAEAQYDIRVTRLTADTNDTSIRDQANLTAIRSIQSGELPSHANIAEIAVRIKASNELNGQLQTLNAIVQQFAPVWDGTNWTAAQPVRHPAWIYARALMGPQLRDAVPDTRIDLTALKAWADEEPHWTCDLVIDSATRLADVLDMICSTGRARRGLADLKYSVIRDGGAGGIVQHFTPRNSWGFTGRKFLDREIHAFRVRVTSQRKEWAVDEVMVYADGFDAASATEIETLSLPGVVLDADGDNQGNAYRLARYHMAVARLRPEEFHFYSDLDHVVCQMGDKVRVVHDVPLFGVGAGRVKSSTTTEIVIDEKLAVDPSQYRLRIRRSDGSEITAYGTSTGDGTWTLTSAMSEAVDPDDLVLVERTELQSVDLLITGIVHMDELQAKITTVPAAPDVLTADTGTIPTYDPQITPSVIHGPTKPVVLATRSGVDTALIETDLSLTARVAVQIGTVTTITGSAALIALRWRKVGSSRWTYGEKKPWSSEVYTGGLETGETYDVSIASYDVDDRSQGWVSAGQVVASTSDNVLPAPAWAATAGVDTITLSGPVTENLNRMEYRIYAATAASTNLTLVGHTVVPNFVYRPPATPVYTRYKVVAVDHSGDEGIYSGFISVVPTGVTADDLAPDVDQMFADANQAAQDVQDNLDAAVTSLTVDYNAAEVAATNAANAQTAAEAARDSAAAHAATADGARSLAETAQTASESARDSAAAHATTADGARAAAEAAQTAAETAETSATAASGVAVSAQTAAEGAAALSGPSTLTEPVAAWTSASTSSASDILKPAIAFGTFVDNDADFGDAFVFPDGANRTVGQAIGFEYEHGRIYEAVYRFKVHDDGANSGCSTRFGITTQSGTTVLQSNLQTAAVVYDIADGVQEIRVQFAETPDTSSSPDDTVTIGSASATADRAYIHIRQNESGATDARITVAQIIIRDVTDALAAAGSASAAATSASAAGVSETAAGQSAAAAATSATDAATDASNASTSASQAATSETNAAGSASQASTSAGAAATSETNAGTSASAAATSASAAATSATDAGTSASAADADRIAAQTARTASEAARDQSVSARDDAEGFSAAASASQTVAAEIVRDLLPYDFEQEGDYWITSSFNVAPDNTVPFSASWATFVDDGARCVEIAGDGTSNVIGTRGIVVTEDGRTYRLTLEVKQIAGTIRTNGIRLRARRHNGGYTGYSEQNEDHTISALNVWETFTLEYTNNGHTNLNLRAMFQVQAVNQTGDDFRFRIARIEDVTSELAAAGSASAAASSASSAAASETAAGQSASAAQTSETNAATDASNASTSASQAATSATSAAGSASTAASQASTAAQSATDAGDSANAASSSAQAAATSATDAGQSASAAQASETAAATSESNASTSETNAASSATSASGSAAAAASSATVAADTGDQINRDIATIGQSTFEGPLESWTHEGSGSGSPSSKSPITANKIVTGDVDFGTCFDFNSGSNTIVGPMRLFPMVRGVSVYEVRVTFKVHDDGDGSSGTDDDHRLGMTIYGGDTRDDNLDNLQSIEFNAKVADGVQVVSAWLTLNRNDVNALDPADAGVDDIATFNTAPLTTADGVMFQFRQNAGMTNNQQVRIKSFEVRDVTALADALIAQNAADASASAAATSEAAAAASETAAGQSASAAATSATTASTQASNASTSATQAASSATDAAGSASDASASAATAATSENNAGQSASAAASSASAASTSATDAGQSATAAASSQTAASTSASQASVSENNAATSATNASNSASLAAADREVASRMLSSGMVGNPTLTEWTGTWPVGFTGSASTGSAVTKDTTNGKYVNAALMQTASPPTNARPYIEVRGNNASNFDIRPEDTELVLIRAEIELVSGSWGGCRFQAQWRGATNGNAYYYPHNENIPSTHGIIHQVEFMLERPSGYVEGTSSDYFRVLFYGTTTGAAGLIENEIRLHSINVQAVTQSAVAALVQQTMTDVDGFSQSFAGLTATVNGSDEISGIQATSWANPDGTSGSLLTLLGDNVIVPGSMSVGLLNSTSFTTAGLAIFGNALKSNDFNGTINGSGSITNNGSVGWAIAKDGGMILNDLVVREWVQVGAVSDGSTYTRNTTVAKNNNTTLATLYLGAFQLGQFWQIAIQFKSRIRRKYGEYFDNKGGTGYNLKYERTQVKLQWRTKDGGVWTGWSDLHDFGLGDYGTGWDTYEAVVSKMDVHDEVEMRLRVYITTSTDGTQGTNPGDTYYNNLDDITFVARALVR